MVKKGIPRIGWMVLSCPTHLHIKDDEGKDYPVIPLAEKSARRLRELGYELVRFEGEEGLFKGDIPDALQIHDYRRDKIVTDSGKAFEAVKIFHNEDVDCIICYLPVWVWAADYMQAFRSVSVPLILWAPLVAEGATICAASVLHGSLDELGIEHKVIYSDIHGDPGDRRALREIESYSKAAMVKNNLRKSRYGRIGGRSMGMNPSRLDFIDWMDKFGIEVEHIDQYAVVVEAGKFKKGEIEDVYNWIMGLVSEVPDFDTAFEREIRLYLAYQKVIKQFGIDFSGLKSTFELSDNYVAGTLAQSLINTEGHISAGTSHDTGALVMFIMQLFGSEPVFMGDIIDLKPAEGLLTMINDGKASFNLAESKKHIHLRKHPTIESAAGGICVQLTVKPGPITFGALYRVKGEYLFYVTSGKVLPSSIEDIKKCRCGWPNWPHAFIKLDADPWQFLQNIRSQYIQFCYGDLIDEFKELCRLYRINCVVG
jgi:L-fucose isomerase